MNYWLFAMNKRCKKVIFQYYIVGNLSYLINVQSKKVHTGLQNLPKINKRTCTTIRDTRVAGTLMEHFLEGIAPLRHWNFNPNEKSNK